MKRDSRRHRQHALAALAGIGTLGLALSSTRPVAGGVLGVGVLLASWGASRDAQRTASKQATVQVAHISHELRTPLTSILGIMDVLAQRDVAISEDESEELIGLAHGEALHMSHVVSNLMAAGRIARDSLTATPEPIDPVAMVDRALERVPSVAKRTFVSRHDAQPIDVDPALTLQILLNLIQNVDRYAPDGEVAIEFVRTRGLLHILVSDDGPGLDGSKVFTREGSGLGMGIGLRLSRRLARLMGGDLKIVAPRRAGTTLDLSLPTTDALPEPLPSSPETPRRIALSPRARLLVDMTEALSDRSLDRVVTGLQKLCVDLLGAHSVVLATGQPDTGFEWAGSFTADQELDVGPLVAASGDRDSLAVPALVAAGFEAWEQVLDAPAAMFTPVRNDDETLGVLSVGWKQAAALPGEHGRAVLAAIAQLAAFALDRTALVHNVAFERELRASVMESLPLAISVFAGDPPRVIDWNRRERDMLGIADDSLRPADLEASQVKFDVRFADGTPLDLDTAPVTHAIRTGRSMGPFLLRVRRADGTETTTRTYCAPFFDEEGNVMGAVVTSEELDATPSSLEVHPPTRRTA